MRIIAGKAKGHRLKVAKSGVRPTSERVREAIFNRLTALGLDWDSRRVLDAFAGSGAFALEALSRGAEFASVVEKDPDVLLTITHNSDKTKLALDVILGDVRKILRTRLSGPYNLIFLDPPYEFSNSDIEALLQELHQHNLLEKNGMCIVERSSRMDTFETPDGYEVDEVRDYGDTRVIWLVW